jgi:hypothetical protein
MSHSFLLYSCSSNKQTTDFKTKEKIAMGFLPQFDGFIALGPIVFSIESG